MKVLVVEDHLALRFFLTTELQERGHLPLAHDGMKSAMSSISEFAIDVVVTDYNLPDAEGSEFIHAVRGKMPDASIIVVSGSDSSEDQEAALKAGADHWVMKPYDLDEVVQMIESLGQGQKG